MFDKITMLGKVELDKVLFRFEGEPIIFVCKNKSGTRYLCINTGYGYEPTWLIARSTRKTLLKMLMNEISVLDYYNTYDDPAICSVSMNDYDLDLDIVIEI